MPPRIRIGLLSVHYEKLVGCGAHGRCAYRIFLERADFLFPAVYGLYFATVTTLGFSPLFPNRKLSSLPLFTTIFDYAETLCLLAILRSFAVEWPGKARQRIHPRQVDFRRSQYRIVAGGNFGFADSQSSSSSFRLEAWTGLQFELTHRGASLHA